MGNSKEPNSRQSEYEGIIDKLNIENGPSSDLTESSINNQVPREWKDKCTADSDENSEKAFSEKQDSKAAMNELLDTESAYSQDSFCSDISSESEVRFNCIIYCTKECKLTQL